MPFDQLNRASLPAVARLIARLALAGLFAWAALPKLADPSGFVADLSNYRVLPEQWLGLLAVALPPLELLCALGLIVGPYQRGAALLVGAMLLVFAVAMAQARMRGIDLECGCFGAQSRTQVSWAAVARNLALASVAAWVAVGAMSTRVRKTDPSADTHA